MDSLLDEKQEKKQTRELVSLFLLGVLLFMRLIWLAPERIFFPISQPQWWFPVFEIVTYASTAALVWWERDNFPLYYIDLTALIILIPLKMISTIVETYAVLGGVGVYWWVDVRLLFEPIAIGLLFGLIASRVQRFRLEKSSHCEKIDEYVRGQNFRGLLFGFVIGVFVGTFLGLLLFIQNPIDRFPITIIEVLTLVMYQLCNAAVLEEPLFRGFLWGHLRKRGVRDFHILIIQTLLFWFAHFYYITTSPMSFWVIVPIGGIAMGLVVWKTRSLGASMLTHGFNNAIVQVAYYFYLI